MGQRSISLRLPRHAWAFVTHVVTERRSESIEQKRGGDERTRAIVEESAENSFSLEG